MAQKFAAKIAERYFELKSRLKSTFQANYKLLLIVGAGLSFESGLPLSAHLSYILRSMGYSVESQEQVVEAFNSIDSSDEADRIFKMKFKGVLEDGGITPTKAHEILVSQFENEKILEIICYNWDNLIEICHEDLTGRPIKKISSDADCRKEDGEFYHALWKLHGDVERLDDKWIYPGHDVPIPPCLSAYCTFLSNQHSATLIVISIGCSESDKDVAALMDSLSRFCTIFRIGMDMRLFQRHRDYLLAPASWIIPQLF